MRTPSVIRPEETDGTPPTHARVVITDDGLELAALSPVEVRTLRAWIGRVNGSTNIQPYLEEESPGRFRLYVGNAAERARTAKGVQ